MNKFVLSLLLVGAFAIVGTLSQYKRVCYYYDPTMAPVSAVNFTVCTHIIYYGVTLDTDNITFYWKYPSDLPAVEALKQARSVHNFKLMTVLGGNFPTMSGSETNRTKFANSLVSFLRKNDLDGFDFDWEFPKVEYREPFAALAQACRMAMDAAGEPRLLLSMAATGVESLVVESYDIPSLAESLDFLDIMGYDYRSWENGFPLTAHHSPLYATKYDTIYMNTLNLNWSANYFASHGLPKEKIILGIPAYAHSYELLTTSDHGMFAPATGVANPASMDHQQICDFLKQNGSVRVWDSYAQVPYAYNGKRWYCFDDMQSVAVKANYIKANGFGGVMIWSLQLDYDGVNRSCGYTTDFPIHSLLYDMLTSP